MVDLPCHILPGLDDGAATMEVSLAMAESAIADGITHVVATPHMSNEYDFDLDHVRELCDELQAKVGDRLATTYATVPFSEEIFVTFSENAETFSQASAAATGAGPGHRGAGSCQPERAY